ncbi:nucleoside hydrolase [Candidatus Woesearchaeota archaeon]|nr:nucleoside hydrolase [Candidatus Woesearchaeota archaeon]
MILNSAKHVVLDTDIGGDPDDAYALALGLNSPEVQVDLVVTSDEHKGHRKNFAERFVDGKIPVVQGADLGNSRLCVVCDISEKSGPDPDYLDKVAQVVQKNRLTYYVCISPQTNLARFLEYAPALKQKLHLVIMGGNTKKAEHNVRYDIEAAKKVISSGVKQKWVLSDVTVDEKMRITPDSSIFRKLKASKKPECRLIMQNEERFWQKLYPSNFLHDPLTLSTLISDTVKFVYKRMQITDEGVLAPGQYEIEVSESADVPKLLNLLERIF